MSHRQEEKARRRAEREAHEQAAAKAEARRALGAVVVGAILALAVVAAIVVAVTFGGGSSTRPASSKDFAKAPLPAQRTSNLEAAASAAGCGLANPQIEGREHTTDKVSYKTNPPSSGNHDPVPAQDGAYAPGNPPGVGHAVHALEHGRVEIQWGRAATRHQIGQLATLFDEKSGYHTLLFANQTAMPYAVAASAWGHLLGCKRFTPAAFDALRAFRARYVDKGPEFVP